MGRMRRALQQRLPVAAGIATLTVFLAAGILLPKTTSEVLRDSAFDIELAGDQWLRRPAPSDLKVIVVDIDRASIDAARPVARSFGAAEAMQLRMRTSLAGLSGRHHAASHCSTGESAGRMRDVRPSTNSLGVLSRFVITDILLGATSSPKSITSKNFVTALFT